MKHHRTFPPTVQETGRLPRDDHDHCVTNRLFGSSEHTNDARVHNLNTIVIYVSCDREQFEIVDVPQERRDELCRHCASPIRRTVLPLCRSFKTIGLDLCCDTIHSGFFEDTSTFRKNSFNF
ncbi:conserved domain protein [Actinomyces sp. oral taxon 170 str. F0386]|nr:conserved domain protein [Actinomyces sp. oral taxon 170 str. F0386]